MWQTKYVGEPSEWTWDLRRTLHTGYSVEWEGQGCLVPEESCMAWDGMCGIQQQQNTRIGVDWYQRLMEKEVGYTGCSENKEVPTCSFEDLRHNSLYT